MFDLTRRGFFGSSLLSLPFFNKKPEPIEEIISQKIKIIDGDQVIIKSITENEGTTIAYYKNDPKIKNYKHGILHREDGPAFTIFDKDFKKEIWYKDGYIQRIDGPAITEQGKDIYREEWCIREGEKGGVYHRDNGPAIINIHKTSFGSELKIWYKNGFKHRENGPAVILIRDGSLRNFKSVTKEWHLNGKLHRKGNPALICWGENQIIEEKWSQNGYEYREGIHPSWIQKSLNGKITFLSWNNKKPPNHQINRIHYNFRGEVERVIGNVSKEYLNGATLS